MATKRKHGDFTEAAPPQATPATAPAPAGPMIHPSRMAGNAVLARTAGVDAGQATKKTKTVAKKRYLRVKAKKHRKLKAAKKASAPKNKNKISEGCAGDDGGEQDAQDEDDDEDGDEDMDGNAEAGPSSPRAQPVLRESSLNVVEPTKRKKEKKDKGKAKEEVVEEKGDDEIVPGGANDKAAAKEQRKADKRAKRDARHLRREQEAAEEAERQRELPQLLSTQPMGDSDSEDEEVDIGSDSDDGLDSDDLRSLSGSPPPLEAFPLPTSAPAPDPSILSRQGLPTGITDATFIPQDLKLAVNDLTTTRINKVVPGLSDHMKARLAELDITEFFAVQAYMLPKLLSLKLVPWPTDPRNDYLISAPTGSGKTLAYCIPIIEMLRTRLVTRLRAMIVLPTRDLVVQVRETLELLSKGTNLKIGVVGGQHSFKHEQRQLIDDMETKLLGGSSKVDILIATPGRLMDHLSSTPNFTLQHLRFLVIDEADRLLNQSFQNWLSKILSHLRPPTSGLPEGFERKPWDRVADNWLEGYALVKPSSDLAHVSKPSCQKLLFSATLTRDPAKVAALDLHDPEYYVVQSSTLPQTAVSIGEQFSLPAELSEKMIVLEPALKPLVLIHLIHHAEYQVKSALVFTKSVESANRLVQLLNVFEEVSKSKIVVKSYTSEMKPGERKKILADFTKGDIHLLVCSDLIARGMDLPTVNHVVSYDIPLDMRKYVHRVGRTARAGRSGTAWSLVENQETYHFKNMLKAAGHDQKVTKLKIKESDLDEHKLGYEIAVGKLRQIYSKKEEE